MDKKILNKIINFALALFSFGIAFIVKRSKVTRYVALPIFTVLLTVGIFFIYKSSGDTPVSFAAIESFGKTTDGANVQTFSGDRIYLSTATPANSGTLTSCWARVRVTGASTSEMKVVLYTDNGGTPDGGTFVGQSDEVVVNWTTSTLTEFVVSGTVNVTGGTPYWLGVWADDPGTPSYEYKRDDNANVVHFAAVTYAEPGTPTSPFVSGGTANGPHNVYCEYDTGSGVVEGFGDLIIFE